MSLKRIGIVVALLVLLVGFAAASAGSVKAESTNKTMADSIVVVPGYSVQSSGAINPLTLVSPMTVSSSIMQGQTNWHSKYVGPCTPNFYIDLNWGNSANSLRLRLYCADGSIKGPYFDDADGRIDGRICLNVCTSDGGYLPVGTYYAEVYGYRVSGVQSYTI